MQGGSMMQEKDTEQLFSELKEEYEASRGGEFDSLSFNEKVALFYTEHAAKLSRESLLEQAEKWYNARHSKMEAALKRRNTLLSAI